MWKKGVARSSPIQVEEGLGIDGQDRRGGRCNPQWGQNIIFKRFLGRVLEPHTYSSLDPTHLGDPNPRETDSSPPFQQFDPSWTMLGLHCTFPSPTPAREIEG